jgi:DNA-binding response OmpR family regulator
MRSKAWRLAPTITSRSASPLTCCWPECGHTCVAAGNQQILQYGDLWLDAKNYATRVKGEWVDLRPQEFRLLIALAQSSGVPVSRRELIRRAGATWRGASSRTVDMNISRIRACVESPSDYTYIHSIRGVGYRFEPIPKETSSQASSKKRSV